MRETMRKRFLCLAIGAWVLCGSGLPAYAEDYTGGQGWQVEFTGEGMESSFTSSDISDAVYALQPGDSVTLFLSLKNSGPQDTDWYMANEVLSSLEDSQGVAGGGAYTYRLAYTGNTGEEEVLFSSENVGGEKTPGAGVGLHEATESLEEFFYLDRLGSGDGGTVTLRVVLDGETQGNTYQNTLASLQMNFAVEKAGEVPGTEEGGSTPGGPDSQGGSNTPETPQPLGAPTPNAYILSSVKTGDPFHMLFWSALALASGVALLIPAVLYMKKGKGEDGSE
jgi:hypothetical protein